MGAITNYTSAIHDMTVFDVGGNDILGIFMDGSLEFTLATIDFNFATADWVVRDSGIKDWRVTCRKAVEVSPIGASMLLAGTGVVITVTAGSFSLTGTGLVTTSTIGLGNPWDENITIVQAGGDPDITS